MQPHNIRPNILYFNRWSRKAYAAFCSIGRCVNIGTLNYKIADCSLKKQSVHMVCEEDISYIYTSGTYTESPPLIEKTKQEISLFPVHKESECHTYIPMYNANTKERKNRIQLFSPLFSYKNRTQNDRQS